MDYHAWLGKAAVYGRGVRRCWQADLGAVALVSLERQRSLMACHNGENLMHATRLLLALTIASSLWGCGDKTDELKRDTKQAVTSFVNQDYAAASRIMKSADRIYIDGIPDWPTCISGFYQEAEEIVVPISQWNLDKSERNAGNLTALLQKGPRNLFDYFYRDGGCHGPDAMELMATIAALRESFRTGREQWRKEVLSLYPETVAAEVQRIDREAVYADYLHKDQERSWNSLSEEDKTHYSEGDPAVRACLDTVFSGRDLGGVSKGEVADGCRVLLSP